eukprot:gene32178-36324_t
MADQPADNGMWDLIAVGERIAAGELSAREVTSRKVMPT